jgi:pantoate--beta-alanine ligase
MGYLHQGHIALVERGRREADAVVASIFVNPTQFAPNEDFAAYPRDLEGDSRKLEAAGCDLLYLPRQEEIYPAGFSTYISVEGITGRYEGEFRPTHFRGVTTVVAKFFNIIAPDVALFGQKDAQQVAVIRQMIRDLNFDIRLVVVDTIREPDGLAMSSRNVYLSPKDRQQALTISRALLAAYDAISRGATLAEATALMRSSLSPEIKVEYADIINDETFQPATNGDSSLRGIVAGRVGRTRLIDNMKLGR